MLQGTPSPQYSSPCYLHHLATDLVFSKEKNIKGNTIAYFHLQACAIVMRRDFEFWGLDELSLEPCCALKFYPQIETCNLQIEGDMAEKLKEEKEKLAENFGDSKLGKMRWDTHRTMHNTIHYFQQEMSLGFS